MAKIDRLGWAAGTCFVSYGVRIGIRVNKPEVLERLPDQLPHDWKPVATPMVDALFSLRVSGLAGPNVRRFHLLYSGAVRRARTLDLDVALESLESALRLTVAAAARRRVFVHAGVVGWRGRAIILPGRSFSGKTTLVASLLRAGATYYSDEFAVLDARGRVYPFPKPLSIREGSTGGARKCSAESFGSRQGVKPLPVGLIVLPRYRPGARWRPRRLSPGQGLLALLANTVPVRKRPEDSVEALQKVVSSTPMVKGVRGEADDMVESLLRLCA